MLCLILGMFLIGMASATWTASLDTDLVAYYRLNNTPDDEINSYDGTEQSASYGTGKIDDALTSGYINISDNNDFDFSGAFSISLWYQYSGEAGDDIIISKNTDATAGRWFISWDDGDDDLKFYSYDEGNSIVNKIINIGSGWHHIVVTRDASNDWVLYVDNVSEDTATNSIDLTGTHNIGLGANPTGTVNDNVDVDEVAIWKGRALSVAEVSDLWDGGNGISYEAGGGTEPSISISLNEPGNGTQQTGDIDFNATITPTNANITNSTLKIWDSDGNKIYNITDTYSQNTTVTVNQTVLSGNFSVGDYYWNVEGCYENGTGGQKNCTSASENYTFEWIPFSVDSVAYDTPVLETSEQTFTINITIADGYNIGTGSNLDYNGTAYSNPERELISGAQYQITRTINIPVGKVGFGNHNRTFSWNISVVNDDTGNTIFQSSSEYEQEVDELVFGLCNGGTRNISMLNFTMFDETDSSQINGSENATTFQATFDFGADADNKIKNYTIDNVSVTASEFDFCTNDPNNTIYTNMEAFFTAAGYVDKQYFLNNATLTNSTNEISLYLLPDATAIEFFISVERDLEPIEGATINIEKYFVGEGVYKTTEIDETDTSGEITAYLDLDKKYRFTISQDGEILGIINKRAACEAAPCTITLSLSTAAENPFSNFDTAFASNVLYNLSYNDVTKIVTFDFIDTTGLATYFRMIVYKGFTNQSSTKIYDNKVYSSSGSMTFNASNYTSGDFTVETYISKSPEEFIDFITFVMDEVVETLGITGLFVAFILLLVVIFGLSFKPSMLVMAVPLALTVFKLANMISLSNTSIVFFYVMAIIALFALSK